MNEQLWLGFRSWPCIMTILVISVTVTSAASGSDGSAQRNELVQPAEPTGEEEESEQASEASSRDELLLQLREEKSQQLRPYEVSDTEARTRRWEKAKFPTNWLVKGWRGFRPVFGGMPSGSGFVFGGGYIHGLVPRIFNYYTKSGSPCVSSVRWAKRAIDSRIWSADLVHLNGFGSSLWASR